MEIKFLKKGIKIDGKYYPVFYSPSKNNVNGNATIYLRTYEPLPDNVNKILDVENNSDMMTDYFEKDRIRIAPTSPYFEKVEGLANKI